MAIRSTPSSQATMSQRSVAAVQNLPGVLRQLANVRVSWTSATKPSAVIAMLLAVLFLAATHTTYAETSGLSSLFEQANQHYERGEFAEAAASYQKLAGSGKVSAPIYFNYGNALFKSGQIGRAIISYRLAEQLVPRDPDIQANLRYARDQVENARNQPAIWRRALHFLSVDEIALLFTFAYWSCFILLTIATLRHNQNRPPFIPTTGWLSAVLGVWLLTAASLRHSHEAVVVAPEAVARYGPLDESQSYFTLHDGTEVTLVGTKDDWFQIRDSRGRIGWVRSGPVALAVHASLIDQPQAH